MKGRAEFIDAYAGNMARLIGGEMLAPTAATLVSVNRDLGGSACRNLAVVYSFDLAAVLQNSVSRVALARDAHAALDRALQRQPAK